MKAFDASPHELVLSALLTALLPMLQGAAAGNPDIGVLPGQAVGGGVAGAIVTAIVGAIKNGMAGAK